MGSDPSLSQYKSQFQAAVNAFTSSCNEAGYKIGPFNVLGSSSSSSPSSAAGSGSGSGSGSGTGTGAAGPIPTKSPNGASSVRAGGAFVGFAGVVIALIL
ncbi:hypothetical protein FRC10_010594 [Ceratobasidium sp. 414]|nr:hypothetical protein FRC10_010594 [Ceratobasidium sp. 414]